MAIASGLIEVARRIAADRHANGGVDVARREAVARGTGAVDVDLDRRLAERGENCEVGDARNGRQHRLDLGGGVRERLQVVAIELDRILAFHAGHRLGDIVLEVLREIELDAGKLRCELGDDFGGELVLVETGAPLVHRFQGRKEFGVEKTGGVGAVVGPAVLRHDRLHFGKFTNDIADAVDITVAFIERDRGRQRRTNPEIALFQLRQKLQAQ